MSTALTSFVFVLLVWWAGTAVVLLLQHRLQPTATATRWLLPCAAVSSFAVLIACSAYTQVAAMIGAFVAAIVLWGCIELSYYLGLLTGTHSRPCPPSLSGWTRFRTALATSIWHELAALGTGAALTIALWNSVNPTGLYAFLVLWLMRWSAKLNLYLGVPCFETGWFPKRLAHLPSYMNRQAVTPFFFLSVGAASVGVVGLLVSASRTAGAEAMIYSLPAVMLLLAIVEHVFMALPIADTRLWQRVFEASRERRGARL